MNRIRCNNCKDLLHSKHRHDFQRCKCGAVSVDGGDYYSKLSGKVADIVIVRDDGQEYPFQDELAKAKESNNE